MSVLCVYVCEDTHVGQAMSALNFRFSPFLSLCPSLTRYAQGLYIVKVNRMVFVISCISISFLLHFFLFAFVLFFSFCASLDVFPRTFYYPSIDAVFVDESTSFTHWSAEPINRTSTRHSSISSSRRRDGTMHEMLAGAMPEQMDNKFLLRFFFILMRLLLLLLPAHSIPFRERFSLLFNNNAILTWSRANLWFTTSHIVAYDASARCYYWRQITNIRVIINRKGDDTRGHSSLTVRAAPPKSHNINIEIVFIITDNDIFFLWLRE